MIIIKHLSEQQKSKKIEWLKKQRDGYIVGDYRNILCHVYQNIKSISMNSGCCTLQDLVKKDSIYYRTEAQVLEYCEMLKGLDYINICNHANNITFTILKPIDF